MDNSSLYHYRCTLVKVIDGDTLDLLIDLGFHLTITKRVRMLGYNSPEMFGGHYNTLAEKEAGARMRGELSKMTLGKPLIIRTELDNTDKYGRILGHLYSDDLHINDLMGALCNTEWQLLQGMYPEIYKKK